MKVITECHLKHQLKDQTPDVFILEEGQILTPSAASFLFEKKITVQKKLMAAKTEQCVESGAGSDILDKSNQSNKPGKFDKPDKPSNPAPPYPKPRFISVLDGGEYHRKPEYMTQIHGLKLVPKDHPRIILRGLLDSLQADILLIQHQARQRNQSALAADIGDLLTWSRNIMAAEVTGKPLEDFKPMGLSSEDLREQSHHPKRFFGVGHLLPSSEMDELTLWLNKLRTVVREVELAAVKAFRSEMGLERLDIIQALNRMSSAVYLMMLKLNMKRYN